MSTTAELLKGAAELFPDEVVTQAHVRHLDLPCGAGRFALITLDNGFDHTKPTTFGPAVAGEPERRHRPGREGGRGRRDRRRRHHRQAVHLRGRRRPQGRRAAEASTRTRSPSARAATTSSSASPSSRVPDLRVLQRRGHGRRRRGRPALHLPHRLRGAARRSRCPRSSSAWSPAGAAARCCRT